MTAINNEIPTFSTADNGAHPSAGISPDFPSSTGNNPLSAPNADSPEIHNQSITSAKLCALPFPGFSSDEWGRGVVVFVLKMPRNEFGVMVHRVIPWFEVNLLFDTMRLAASQENKEMIRSAASGDSVKNKDKYSVLLSRTVVAWDAWIRGDNGANTSPWMRTFNGLSVENFFDVFAYGGFIESKTAKGQGYQLLALNMERNMIDARGMWEEIRPHTNIGFIIKRVFDNVANRFGSIQIVPWSSRTKAFPSMSELYYRTNSDYDAYGAYLRVGKIRQKMGGQTVNRFHFQAAKESLRERIKVAANLSKPVAGMASSMHVRNALPVVDVIHFPIRLL